jgi:hypothetical protein
MQLLDGLNKLCQLSCTLYSFHTWRATLVGGPVKIYMGSGCKICSYSNTHGKWISSNLDTCWFQWLKKPAMPLTRHYQCNYWELYQLMNIVVSAPYDRIISSFFPLQKWWTPKAVYLDVLFQHCSCHILFLKKFILYVIVLSTLHLHIICTGSLWHYYSCNHQIQSIFVAFTVAIICYNFQIENQVPLSMFVQLYLFVSFRFTIHSNLPF